MTEESVKSKSLKNPCYKCEDRHEGCHGKCVKYKSWSAAVKEKHDKEREAFKPSVWGYYREQGRLKDR